MFSKLNVTLIYSYWQQSPERLSNLMNVGLQLKRPCLPEA